jgi:hypothetical protein
MCVEEGGGVLHDCCWHGGRLMGIIIGVQVPLHELDVVVVDTVHFELAH